MAESECHSQGGQQNRTNSSSRSVLSSMTPGVGTHVPMAPGSANHTSMNMRSNMPNETRHMNMDGNNIDKIYRKFACSTLVTPSTATSMTSGNQSATMSLTSDANNPVSMNPGEQTVGEGGEQNLDKLYRKFPCPTCFKGFKSKQQLIQHNLVHTGARKYHCSYCDKSFKQLCHLQQHHRIHTGEKPYKCTLGDCDRSFAQLSNLQHHLRNHDDQVKKAANKQHACVICNRSYTNESSLKSHTLKNNEWLLQAALSVELISDNEEELQEYKKRTYEEKINWKEKVLCGEFFQHISDVTDEGS
uniref:C2H2-type domain-containing protein n=1 Tax=Octopus bimaculoides TaxID=37653 RepID=A0A0L8H474_OCTBM